MSAKKVSESYKVAITHTMKSLQAL